MAYAARPTDFHGGLAPRPASAPRPGLLSRLFNAVFESRQPGPAHCRGLSGAARHRFTDSVEREINERLFNGGWNAKG